MSNLTGEPTDVRGKVAIRPPANPLGGSLKCGARLFLAKDTKPEPNVLVMEINDLDKLQCDTLYQ